MTKDEIRFKADFVEAASETYTPDFIVHGIYFGEGDPEQGGQHWNFTRNLETDDQGVCTVKEIQQVTVYGGIDEFVLGRNSLLCEFDENHAITTGTKKLLITYDMGTEKWAALAEKAKLVFSGESYFRIG